MIGKYAAKLDDKNRLIVPAKLREELGGDFYVTLGVNCGHRCLTIYKASDWQTLSDNYNTLPISQKGAATSLIFMNAAEQFHIFRVGMGVSGLDKSDAKLIHRISDPQLILQGIKDPLSLRAVAQRSIQDLDLPHDSTSFVKISHFI